MTVQFAGFRSSRQVARRNRPSGDQVAPYCSPASPIALIEAENSTFGCSRSAAAIQWKFATGRDNTCNRTGHKFIAYRAEGSDEGLFVLPALGGVGLQRKISSFAFIRQGRRMERKSCFKRILSICEG